MARSERSHKERQGDASKSGRDFEILVYTDICKMLSDGYVLEDTCKKKHVFPDGQLSGADFVVLDKERRPRVGIGVKISTHSREREDFFEAFAFKQSYPDALWVEIIYHPNSNKQSDKTIVEWCDKQPNRSRGLVDLFVSRKVKSSYSKVYDLIRSLGVQG